MAIEAVHDATVAGNDVAEILDLERSLETRSEETPEGTDDAAKRSVFVSKSTMLMAVTNKSY